MEMDALHIDGPIKKRFLSADRLIRKGLRVTFTTTGAEIRNSSNSFCTIGIRDGPYYWHNLYPTQLGLMRLRLSPLGFGTSEWVT